MGVDAGGRTVSVLDLEAERALEGRPWGEKHRVPGVTFVAHGATCGHVHRAWFGGPRLGYAGEPCSAAPADAFRRFAVLSRSEGILLLQCPPPHLRGLRVVP